MKYIFNFPDIGEGLDEGTIVEWYVVKGMEIKAGDPLVKMETDKVVTDIPSPRTGTISATFGQTGDTIHVGDALVEIDNIDVPGNIDVNDSSDAHIQAVEEANAGVVGTIEVAGNYAYLPAGNEGIPDFPDNKKALPPLKSIATPVARAMAKDMGVDINLVRGTGPTGRVTIQDVKKYVEAAGQPRTGSESPTLKTPSEEFSYEPLSQLRKTIAKNMSASLHNAAHMSVHDEVEISDLFNLRQRFKNVYAEKGLRLSYLPFIIKATLMALKSHKIMNAQLDLDNERIIYKNFYNICVAVDTPDGLVVPVIRNADKLSIAEIAHELNVISDKARDRKLTIDEMKNGTFTITSYGSIGGMFATPVINYPQSGILGIGRIIEKPVIKNNEIVKGIVMPLSLSVDHRIVDGGEVTRFLNEIMKYLADPAYLLME